MNSNVVMPTGIQRAHAPLAVRNASVDRTQMGPEDSSEEEDGAGGRGYT